MVGMDSDMNRAVAELEAGQGGPRDTSELKDRLMAIRKRKRAFAGRTIDAKDIKDRTLEEQRDNRDC